MSVKNVELILSHVDSLSEQLREAQRALSAALDHMVAFGERVQTLRTFLDTHFPRVEADGTDEVDHVVAALRSEREKVGRFF